MFTDISSPSLFYFTHSFHFECEEPDDVLALSDHGRSFVAAVQKNNIYGTQFHPEKSQLQGLGLIKNFAELVLSKTC